MTDLVFIATPHGAIAPVAEALAREADLPWSRVSVCHASGMLTSEILAPLRGKGATVFSFHPLQTFPRDFAPREIVPSARGIFFGVDGEPAAIRKARQLARLLHGKTILVPPALRVFYHAACVVASNHLTVLLATLERMGDSFDRRNALSAFRPIIDATLANVFRTTPAQALSGPVARGGVDTVRDHLRAVQAQTPDLIPYFVRMTAETVRLAQVKGALAEETVEEFGALLRDVGGTSSSHGGMH
jgi:predicted short-subunit dehydrogenase-like oxidoreductase (DUF2520 family)